MPPARGETGPAAGPPLPGPVCLSGLPGQDLGGPVRVPASVLMPEEPHPFVYMSGRLRAWSFCRLPCAGTAGWIPLSGEVVEIFVCVHLRRLMGSLCPSDSVRLAESFCPSV